MRVKIERPGYEIASIDETGRQLHEAASALQAPNFID